VSGLQRDAGGLAAPQRFELPAGHPLDGRCDVVGFNRQAIQQIAEFVTQ
jgi:hypothetical protein